MTPRRAFLCGVGAGSIATTGVFALLSRTEPDSLEQQLDALLTDLRGVGQGAVQGAAVLSDPREAYPWLLDRVQTGHDHQHLSLRERIQDLIESDYASGVLCELDGWKLSHTECALIAASAYRKREAWPSDDAKAGASWLDIEDWGPQTTTRGVVFNPQSDGHGGIWFKARGDIATTRVHFAGEELPVTASKPGFTIGLRDPALSQLINSVGEYDIWAHDFRRDKRQLLGTFRVLEGEDDCAVLDWGPQCARINDPFNAQPNGDSAFWIRMNCAVRSATVMLNSMVLPTTCREDLVTARVLAGTTLETGRHALTVSLASGDRVEVGSFRVDAQCS